MNDHIAVGNGTEIKVSAHDLVGMNEDALWVNSTQLFVKFLSTPPTLGTADVTMAFTE